MPRTMYYAGVVFCVLLALSAGLQSFDALGYLWPQAPHGGGIGFAMAVLFATIPVAALFLRMAALLAARNLFAALFASFAVAATAGAAGIFSVLQIHNALVTERITRVLTDIAAQVPVPVQLNVATGYAAAFFLGVALLALRPYFLIQSSRFLSVLVVMPFGFFCWVFLDQVLIVRALSIPRSSLAFFAGMMLTAASFAAIAIHSLRHRPLFVEVTNLRELLDTPVDPHGRDSRVDLNGRIAFDS